MMKTHKTLTGVLWVCSILGALCAVILLFPWVQRFIVGWIEQNLIHRKIKLAANWMETIKVLGKGGLALIAAFDFFALTGRGRALSAGILGDIRSSLAELDYKTFLKPLLFMFLIYCLASLSLLRANVSYGDDIRRAVTGYHRWKSWSRYVPQFLSTFLHGDTLLADISPLPQLLALLILALGSVTLAHLLSPGGLSIGALIASVPVGLSPYFLSNLSFKYDSPYMAFSVFVPMIPFLFVKSRGAFIASSVVCLLLMCASYQASSGVYIVLALMICFRQWICKTKTNRETLVFLGTAAFSYCFALLLFKMIFMISNEQYGVATAVFMPSRFIQGVIQNSIFYFYSVYYQFGLLWKILLALICCLFIYRMAGISQQKKILSGFVSFLVLLFSFVFSCGAYLALEKPEFGGHSMCGLGVFMAAAGVCLVSIDKRIGFFAVLALNWCFFTFSFAYGNALADQKHYTYFRTLLVLNDLNHLFPESGPANAESPRKIKKEIRIENSIGFGAVTELIAKHHPVIKNLIAPFAFPEDYMIDYFGRADMKMGGNDVYSMNLPVVLDTYYHTIKSDGHYILVTMKE